VSSRQAHPDSPFWFMLWMSVVPPLPMLALSLVVDGPAAIGRSLTTLGTPTAAWALGGLAYTVLVATVLGSGIWTALLARHPSGTVAPFSMLVPVVGFAASWLLLGERPEVGELLLGAVVVAGVLFATRPPRTTAAPVGPAAAPELAADAAVVAGAPEAIGPVRGTPRSS
ncbi:MAG TPA: EamA family transporter, partial [Cellulomonas sp.]